MHPKARRTRWLLAGLLLLAAGAAHAAEVPEPPRLVVEGLDGPPETQEDESEGVRSRWWSRKVGEVTERLAEHALPKPLSPQRWLARWRRQHGCTAKIATWAKPLASVKAPQLTFEGSCKSGEGYVIHVVQLERKIYELHVDASVFAVNEARLREAMRELVSRTRVRE